MMKKCSIFPIERDRRRKEGKEKGGKNEVCK